MEICNTTKLECAKCNPVCEHRISKNKYCLFLEDIYHTDKVYWEKDKEYLVTFENETAYYFGEPIESGIMKDLENKKYKIVEKEI